MKDDAAGNTRGDRALLTRNVKNLWKGKRIMRKSVEKQSVRVGRNLTRGLGREVVVLRGARDTT